MHTTSQHQHCFTLFATVTATICCHYWASHCIVILCTHTYKLRLLRYSTIKGQYHFITHTTNANFLLIRIYIETGKCFLFYFFWSNFFFLIKSILFYFASVNDVISTIVFLHLFFFIDAYALSVVVVDTKKESRRKSLTVINSSTRLCFLFFFSSFFCFACLPLSITALYCIVLVQTGESIHIIASYSRLGKEKISTIPSTAGVLMCMLRRG